MKKRAAGRAAGMVVVSALLCAAVAAQPQPDVPQDTGSAPEPKPAAAELKPNTEDVSATRKEKQKMSCLRYRSRSASHAPSVLRIR